MTDKQDFTNALKRLLRVPRHELDEEERKRREQKRAQPEKQ